MKIPRWLWGLWAAFSVITFAVLEGIALTNDTGNDSLTQTLHFTVPGWLFFTLFSAFVGWFAHHMLTTYNNRKGGR